MAAFTRGGLGGLAASVAGSQVAARSATPATGNDTSAPRRPSATGTRRAGTGTGSSRSASTVDLPTRASNTGGGAFVPIGGQPYTGTPLGEMIATQVEQMMAAMTPALDLAAGFGFTLADALGNGITAAAQSGSIGAGFRELGKTMIGGLGAQIRDFGVKSLMASQLMAALQRNLASFIPGGAIGASLAMIALGSTMVGLAGRGARASFGTTNTGIDRGAATSGTYTERGTLSLPSSLYGGASAPTPSGAIASAAGNLVAMNVTVIGPNDPAAQRQIQQLVKNAAARGSV
jgi:hypothetical protein